MLDTEQLRIRVFSLLEDLNYYDQILQQRCKYETNLWGVREQKKQEDNQEMFLVLEKAEEDLQKKIKSADHMLEQTRIKVLKALGKM
jgi:hypothetical protein